MAYADWYRDMRLQPINKLDVSTVSDNEELVQMRLEKDLELIDEYLHSIDVKVNFTLAGLMLEHCSPDRKLLSVGCRN